MAVYVDDAFIAFRGGSYCHLFADTDDELHALAQRIGLKREWFQDTKPEFHHYDVSLSMRAAAIRAGARECHKSFMVGLVRARRVMFR